MPTADELKAYLAKRGIPVDVQVAESTYKIAITSKSVEDVAGLLASINEPGRFIISVKLGDVIPLIGDTLGVSKLIESVDRLEESMRGNAEKLTATDTENKRQSEESISSLTHKVEVLNEEVRLLIDKLSYIEMQPWWKRFLGVK